MEHGEEIALRVPTPQRPHRNMRLQREREFFIDNLLFRIYRARNLLSLSRQGCGVVWLQILV